MREAATVHRNVAACVPARPGCNRASVGQKLRLCQASFVRTPAPVYSADGGASQPSPYGAVQGRDFEIQSHPSLSEPRILAFSPCSSQLSATSCYDILSGVSERGEAEREWLPRSWCRIGPDK